jgi:DNA helicase-2/ATP-dependent DNA helicase PcrA
MDLDPKAAKWDYRRLIKMIEGKKNQVLSDEEFELHLEEEYVKIFREYHKTLKMSNSMDFGDLIYNTVKIFNENPRVRDAYAIRFKHILVDEMQDTNKAQLDMVRHLASKHNNVIAVGDQDQSIYGWRGACIANIEKFESHFPNAEVAHLSTNYRSTAEILANAEKLINENTNRRMVPLKAKKGQSGQAVVLSEYDQPEDEAEGIAELAMARKWDGYDYKEMTILCRTNALTRSFEECFRRKQIPYVLIGTFGFYDRKEVKNSIAFMKFLANPEDAISFEEIINVPSRGVGPASLLKILDYALENKMSFTEACRQGRQVKGLRKKTADCLGFFVDVLEKFDKSDPYNSIVTIFEESGFLDHLRSTDRQRNEHREDNVLEFLRGFHGYCNRSGNPSLSEYLQEIMLISNSDKDSEENAIRIMTCHAAKGLEFDIVFVPGMEEYTFPHKRSIAENNVQEERRVCYVAITRPRDYLYLSRSGVRVDGSVPVSTIPSRFLIEMGLVDKESWEKV